MTNDIQLIPIDKIMESPYQGRFLNFNQTPGNQLAMADKDIEELARSISNAGLLQPILLRPLPDGYFELIDGHRRLLAYRSLNKSAIEAIVKEMSDKDAQVQSIIGNLQRKNLRKIELASAYQKVLDVGMFQTAKELSIALGKDETFVSDTLNLLKLDRRIIEDLGKNDSIKDVRLLRMIRNYDPVDELGESDAQYELYKRVLNEKLTRDEVKYLVNAEKVKKKQQAPLYKISGRGKKIIVELEVRPYSANKRELLLRALREKMNEIEASFGDNVKDK